MRLLNTTTYEFEVFADHRHAPPYAILSHTWADQEVTYVDIEQGKEFKAKLGYKKILHLCGQARADGLAYAWIDTCCIDKRASAELSEAINSMHAWYSAAAVCYVYLADVSIGGVAPRDDWMPQMRQSRWFTRGWTLQELIAPTRVWFFDVDWFVIGFRDEFNDPFNYGGGSKMSTRRTMKMDYTPLAATVYLPGSTSLLDLIVDITGIDSAVFKIREYQSFSIAQRMSWASSRHTTRLEDEAYCLLGLFQINIPLIYGEGRHAFIRLQEEIIRRYQDQSILAWCLPWSERSTEFALLAESPSRFARCKDIESCPPWARRSDTYDLTSTGLRISIPVITFAEAMTWYHEVDVDVKTKPSEDAAMVVLDCHVGGKAVAIFILPHAKDRYVLQRYHSYENPHRFGKFGWCESGDVSAITEMPGLWFVDWGIVVRPHHTITLLREDLISKPKARLPRRMGKLYVRVDARGLDHLRSIEYHPKDSWKRGWSRGASLEALDDTVSFVGALSLRGLDGIQRYDILFEVSTNSRWSLIDHGFFRTRLAIDCSHEDTHDLADAGSSVELSSLMKKVERRAGAVEIGAKQQVARGSWAGANLCATLRYEPGLGLEDFSLNVAFDCGSIISVPSDGEEATAKV